MHYHLTAEGDPDPDGVAIPCSPEPEALASYQRQMLLLESLSLKSGKARVENRIHFHFLLAVWTLLCSCATAVEFHPTSSSFLVIGKGVHIWNDAQVTSGPRRVNQNTEVISWMSLF